MAVRALGDRVLLPVPLFSTEVVLLLLLLIVTFDEATNSVFRIGFGVEEDGVLWFAHFDGVAESSLALTELFESGRNDGVEEMLLGGFGELHDGGDGIDEVSSIEVKDVETDLAVLGDDVEELLAVAHDESVVELCPAEAIFIGGRVDGEGLLELLLLGLEDGEFLLLLFLFLLLLSWR